MSKVIFLDIDGPMIPVRAAYLPGQTTILSVFDPVATSLLLKLLEDTGAKIVISSTWGNHGMKACIDLLEKNGISWAHVHEDWITYRKMSTTRVEEIMLWLRAHPEVTHYVAIDDEQLDASILPNAVLCDGYEGFSWRNYLECQLFLDACGPEKESNVRETITYFKRREIWRTVRKGEPNKHLARQAADAIFPPFKQTNEE